MNPQDEALSVTQADREWADKVIAVEHPNNHEAYEYAAAEVIAAHRLSHSTPGDAEVRAEEAARAWREVAETIEAHLLDRVAMGDQANPATYLSIVQSTMARVGRSTEQLLAARWASEKRLRDEVERLSSLATPSGRAQGEVEPVAYRYVHLDYAGRKVRRYGTHPERVNGHDPVEVHPLYAAPPAQDQGDKQ